ncbi:uncharacterized protein LOC127115177 [Lathyrus oleraceus]|uniref:uncharacterized protein LOC127115177 n=1 Tax=Pisum sativum TaxID=3888 RepID=UPI0021D0DFB4|nr:uncharacterized protein LOC127115177 [Pisum sativum]
MGEKQPRLPFASEVDPREKHALGVVHSNVCRPFLEPSLGGNKYFVAFVDEFTRMKWISLIKFKHEVFTKFKKFIIKAEKQSGQTLNILITGGGGEYNSTEFKKLCQENGIEYEVKVNRDVVVKELEVWDWSKSKSKSGADLTSEDIDFDSKDESEPKNDFESESESEGKIDSEEESNSNLDSDGDSDSGDPDFDGDSDFGGSPDSRNAPVLKRPQRIRNISRRFAEFDILQDTESDSEGEIIQCSMLVDYEPMSMEEALNHKVWLKAMKEELDAIYRNKTWKLT